MKKLPILLLLLLVAALPAAAQRDSVLIVFWNVENFFDYRPDSTGVSELEFSAGGLRHWTRSRFHTKCSAVAKTLLAIADRYGRLPDAVGFAEIENRFVLKQLISSTPLRKLDYGIVHFESPDHRGIDCALLYRKSTLHLQDAVPCHLTDSAGNVVRTRDILAARFDSLAILVNHHPSKVGSGDRSAAMERMEGIRDSLRLEGCSRCLCIGDFNDDVWGTGEGTIKYNGAWEKIDGCFATGFSAVMEHVASFPFLLTGDAAFGGLKPLRTYSGPRYLGGVSDHLPIAVIVYF